MKTFLMSKFPYTTYKITKYLFHNRPLEKHEENPHLIHNLLLRKAAGAEETSSKNWIPNQITDRFKNLIQKKNKNQAIPLSKQKNMAAAVALKKNTFRLRKLPLVKR